MILIKISAWHLLLNKVTIWGVIQKVLNAGSVKESTL